MCNLIIDAVENLTPCYDLFNKILILLCFINIFPNPAAKQKKKNP